MAGSRRTRRAAGSCHRTTYGTQVVKCGGDLGNTGGTHLADGTFAVHALARMRGYRIALGGHRARKRAEPRLKVSRGSVDSAVV
eukprot:6713252-Prymnesium_polylepis.1